MMMLKRSKTKTIPGVGNLPYGYDKGVDGQSRSFYYPHAPTLEKLEEAILRIREGQQPVRKVAAWLQNETDRRLSATRLHKLAWTKEELEERRTERDAKLSKQQKKVKRLKETEKQTRIKAGQAKRRLERVTNKSTDIDNSVDYTGPIEEPVQDVAFTPNPGPQTEFLAANEREVFYGGARGGGKTYSLLIAPLRFVHKSSHRALLLRRSMPELRDVIFQTQQIYPKAYPGAKFKTQENVWHFPSGARIEFGYCENLQDVLRYQGQSYSWIGVDELPQYNSPEVWHFLRSSLRTVDPSIPLHMRATGNPGNVGSGWVKKMFIDPSPPGEKFVEEVVFTANNQEIKSGISRKFIAASVWDNPYLTHDHSYVAMLASLPEAKRQQFLYGNWDVVEDGAFPEFDKDIHVVEPFEIPSGWTKIRAADFGYSSHSGILWGAIDYDNILWIYRELYVNKLTADKLAWLILDTEAGDGTIYDSVLDSSCWARRGDRGPSIAEAMNREGCRFRPSDRSPGSRVAGKIELHKRLTVDEDTEEPGIFFFSTCRNLIAQLPALPLDKRNAEDIDTHSEDHLYDALRYMIMSRPMNRETAWDHIPKRKWKPADNMFGY
jgi:hypothetical protein